VLHVQEIIVDRFGKDHINVNVTKTSHVIAFFDAFRTFRGYCFFVQLLRTHFSLRTNPYVYVSRSW